MFRPVGLCCALAHTNQFGVPLNAFHLVNLELIGREEIDRLSPLEMQALNMSSLEVPGWHCEPKQKENSKQTLNGLP